MGVYQRLQGRADALLRKYGVKRTVTRISVGPYDPDLGRSATTTQSFAVKIVTFPYEIRFINNTTIKQTDLWGLLSAVDLPSVPQPGDKLDVDGVTFTFAVVNPIRPGGVSVVYEAHLNQG